ncbi:MAG: hypothetical protein KIT47_01920 [Rhodoferax sp.]|nr:hypothetical protein [Rhodoferax sp.]
MHNAKARFRANLVQVAELGSLHDHLVGTVAIPNAFDDLLRSELVYGVSALDKLVHDLIRIGMVQTFVGTRPATPKYLSEGIQLRSLNSLSVGSIPPPEVAFEQIVREKLRHLSFQDPVKLADGLGYIWPDAQKWQVLAAALGMSDEAARTRLRLLATRRNAIVHEADLDPITHVKQPITKHEVLDALTFLQNLGIEICNCVI